jgi:hypothetical protein
VGTSAPSVMETPPDVPWMPPSGDASFPVRFLLYATRFPAELTPPSKSMKQSGLDLENFDLSSVLHCAVELQRLAGNSDSMEEVARAVVAYFHQAFVGPDGVRACALVRFFATVPFRRLPAPLQQHATVANPGLPLRDDTPCLTLLGTAGDEPAWNDRRQSTGHQAIPLTSLGTIQRAPMIARLLQEFGVDIGALLTPAPGLLQELAGKRYNVFHVEDALGSPYIPAQGDFVERYGIRSVVGFGGLLPRGELFAVILFSRVPIGAEAAGRFRKVATDVKSLLFRFGEDDTFSRR